MTDVIDLARQLVALPSFVDGDNDESAALDFLYDLLAADIRLTVRKEDVAAGRYNVVATTPGPCRLLLAGHVDTVPPSGGWSRPPLDATTEGGQLFGLGALDMKGGIAAICSAVAYAAVLPSGLALLFYVDEEYDFAGMRAFVAAHTDWQPELVVVAEPSDEAVWNSHRGIVELVVTVTGRSAHASRPASGVNAIEQGVALVDRLRTALATDVDPILGATTVNLAGIRGGMIASNGEITVQANAVADVAEMILDIRTNAESVNAESISAVLNSLTNDTTPVTIDVRHNLGALNTPLAEVAALVAAVDGEGLPVREIGGADKGYGDGQMLREAWGVPVVNFGPSGSGMHGADEWVDIESLHRVEGVYRRLLGIVADATTLDQV